eukprot:Filipodium_phascolosomae@DN1047_c0_g1_i2.p1
MLGQSHQPSSKAHPSAQNQSRIPDGWETWPALYFTNTSQKCCILTQIFASDDPFTTGAFEFFLCKFAFSSTPSITSMTCPFYPGLGSYPAIPLTVGTSFGTTGYPESGLAFIPNPSANMKAYSNPSFAPLYTPTVVAAQPPELSNEKKNSCLRWA